MRNAEDDLKACNAATPGPWQGLRAAYEDCLLVKTPDYLFYYGTKTIHGSNR
jgi:hypothetical protein